jgi:cation transport regulator
MGRRSGQKCLQDAILKLAAAQLGRRPAGPHAMVKAMPYASNEDLPPSVRNHLPPHAQDIYRDAFNHAYAAHRNGPQVEGAAHRIAWGAVKRSYVKSGGEWVARGAPT